MNNNYRQLKTKKKEVETIDDEDEDEDMEAFHRRLKGEIPRAKKLIFSIIIKDNKSKDAKEEAERFEKLSNTMNYDKLFISDSRGKNIIDFSEYMDLDTLPTKGGKKTR